MPPPSLYRRLMKTPEYNEVLGHQWHIAQATRLLRFAVAQGISDEDALAGRIDTTLICDANGKIVPEVVDFPAMERAR